MATRKFSVVLFKASIIIVAFCSIKYVESEESLDARRLFGDKTAYHFVNKTINKPPNCRPVHINMVIRHGSRYPARARILSFTKILNNLHKSFHVTRTKKPAFRYGNLSLPWTFPADWENAVSKELSTLGLQEMYLIASRLLENFPELLKHGYSNNNYSFMATSKLRSSQSAVAFAQGLFEGRGNVGVRDYQPVAIKSSGPSDQDRVLRIFESCRRWKKINAKQQTNSEYAKFMRGPEMQKVVDNIRQRLKLTNKTELTAKGILEMFLTCAFGTQTDSHDVSWCSLFEGKDLLTLEYLIDLKLYWRYSYGRKINSKMACPLYMEIANTLQRYLKNGKPHGIFRFAHTGTVLPLLTLLGLYKDDLPLRADNFNKHSLRKFRPSNIVPMSANIAFVMYECPLTGPHKKGAKKISRMQIQVLVNEAPVVIPACASKTYCSLKKFLDYYSSIISSCKINKICGGSRRGCKKASQKRSD